MKPSDLVVIAARPSMGKTAFALTIADHIAVKRKQGVAFFSLEMSRHQVITRLIAARAKVNSTLIDRNKLSPNQCAAVAKTVGTYKLADLSHGTT